jgi:predicted HD phosphohydrolase
MDGSTPVRHCPVADREHAAHPRIFAHVGHRPGAICIAGAFRHELPDNFVFAILLHELGHLALMPQAHSERAADREGSRIGGVTVVRRSWGPYQRLEFVTTPELAAARRAVSRLTDYRPLRGVAPWTVSR